MAKPLIHLFGRICRHSMGEEVPGTGTAQDEQLRMIWSHARGGVLVASLFAVALALALRGVIATEAMVDAWLAIKLTMSVVRGVQGWQFAKQAKPGQRWADMTLAAQVVDAAVWGLAGLFVTMFAPWPLASFFCAVLACISCVSTFGLQISARYTAGFSAPILVPTALGMFIRGGALAPLGGLGLLMLLGLQLVTAMRSERRLLESIRIRQQAEALAQEKEEALKVAMRQSAVKTQFLANMSHELRTPLHGILGMAKLLHREVSEPALASRVELIQSSGVHLLALINDLLDIARMEAGQFTIRRERHDLRAQIEHLVGIYTVRAAEKGLDFEVRQNVPSPCWVMGDPARFRQVLHNLLGNAIKFTQHGSITLAVEWDKVSGQVRAEVRDTGIGIAPKDLDKVFQAFQQSDAGTLGSGQEGAGLGLTIARDIARALGGDITAHSEPGIQTTMVFTANLPSAALPEDLPQAAPSAAPAPPAVEPMPPAHAAQPPPAVAVHARIEPPQAASDGASLTMGSPRHCLVLLAEDNDVNAMVATNFLEIIGTDTERVKDGREAVRIAMRENNRPDIVLMDCHMPVMNGYEAARLIREQESELGWPRLPIVALTATAGDAERQDCLDAGMDDFLSKPCMLEDLHSAVERWTSPGQLITPPAAAKWLAGEARDQRSANPGASFRT
ncbi:MAG: response regulator [Rubrivivax sp.]|nr:MAG: response regulator [Rubrivivax sp.]